MCPGIGPEGSFGGLPTPLLVLSARSKLSTLLLLRTKNKYPFFCSRLFRSGNWDFGSFLYLLSGICPIARAYSFVFCFVLFFSFWRTGLYFLTGGQVYSGSSITALQQRVQGPPTCLRMYHLFVCIAVFVSGLCYMNFLQVLFHLIFAFKKQC